MTANLFIHEYYYRYRQYRKQIKDIVDAANYIDARNQLNAAIAEHEAKYPFEEFLEQKRDFNFGERSLMVHANNHLNTVIDDNDPAYLDIDNTIKHHSDIVRQELLAVPKPDYNVLDPPVD